nr:MULTISPECIES: DNA-binding protein [Rhizobium]
MRLRDARISKGYGLEELAIATGLTVAEIVAVEDDDHHPLARNVERIEHALR